MFYNVLYLIELYNFHVGSFLWIILHHGENFAQSYEKTWNFQHLEKFLSLEILTFQNEILIFFYFLLNKYHILTCFDELWSLALEFDQNVKVWLFSIQLTFDQLTAKFICQSNGLAMFWTMSLGKNDAIGLLRSCFKPDGHLLGQKQKLPFLSQNPNFDHFALLMNWSNFLRNYGTNLIKWHIWAHNVDMDQNLWSLTVNWL